MYSIFSFKKTYTHCNNNNDNHFPQEKENNDNHATVTI